MPLSPKDYQTFHDLVYSDGHTEIQCAAYLPHAASLLMTGTTARIMQLTAEDRNYFGSTDFIVAAEMQADTGNPEVEVTVWELKAPQCYVMEFDDSKTRCRPSDDLYKAENQLLHYHYLISGDDRFRERNGVMDSDNIKMGGIIIGREDRIIKDPRPESVSKAMQSLKIRRNSFYQHNKLRVLSWDVILRHLEPRVP